MAFKRVDNFIGALVGAKAPKRYRDKFPAAPSAEISAGGQPIFRPLTQDWQLKAVAKIARWLDDPKRAASLQLEFQIKRNGNRRLEADRKPVHFQPSGQPLAAASKHHFKALACHAVHAIIVHFKEQASEVPAHIPKGVQMGLFLPAQAEHVYRTIFQVDDDAFRAHMAKTMSPVDQLDATELRKLRAVIAFYLHG